VGDTSSAPSDLGSRIIKVNHAGEHGAVCIYTGQILLARFTARDIVPTLVEFREHERGHRAIFQAELTRRGRPRCRSYYLCAAGGFVLGVVTGLCGRQAIAATTVAVESVVLRHLEQQLLQLAAVDEQASAAVRAILAEEQLHHDVSESQLSHKGVWGRLVSPVVTSATEAVIWLGMRL
jgi:ubiquinone biosynthesis monooxygenase Coq7